MAKKRKPVEKIVVDATPLVKENQAPSCYNRKVSSCKKELCGEWFDACDQENNDDHAD